VLAIILGYYNIIWA
jgi:hypothetical protein